MMNTQCNDQSYKPKYILLSKKGMATKAFLKYLGNGDTKKIESQIKRGLVQRFKL